MPKVLARMVGGKVLDKFLGFYAGRSKAIVGPSPKCFEYIKKTSHRKKVRILPNSVEMNLFNPTKVDEKEVDTKIESLDDLFEETPANKPKEPTPAQVKTPSETLDKLFDGIDEPKQEPQIEAPKPEEKDTYDLQKELEAKFD